jgi:TolB-like protein/Tfp pilus assembly protein PilF
VGGWVVKPALDRIESGGERVALEPRAMDILIYLAQHPGKVISSDEFITELWDGRIVGENTLYQWIHLLRKALGDDPQNPAYIVTIPKKGYRLIADVGLPRTRVRRLVALVSAALIALVTALYFIQALYFIHWRAPDPDVVNLPAVTEEAQSPSIAVLPFEDLSPDESGRAFAGGMHEAVLTMLANITSIRVISRTSVLAYQNTRGNLKDIGTDLSATHIIEGTVQRQGDRLRVNIQLIDAKTDEHLWAQSYDRELTAANFFSIQSEIASAVSRNFEMELSAGEQARLSSPPTKDFAAYEAYLLGKHLLAKRTRPSMADAAGYFLEAIAIDSNFALAYVGLADAYTLLDWYGEDPSEALPAKAMMAIDKALSLDNRLGEAYASLGSVLTGTDNIRALAAFERSIELNPNYATAYSWYADLLREMGRLDDALLQFEKALELDPLSAIINAEKAFILEEAGRFEEALAQYNRVITIDPNFRMVYLDLATLYRNAFGRNDEAIRLLYKEVAVLNATAEPVPLYRAGVYGDLAFSYVDIGGDAEAQDWIERCLELDPESAGANYSKVKLRLIRGDVSDEADYPPELLLLNGVLDTSNFRHINKVQRLFRNYDLRAGRYASARNRYARSFPELLETSPPEVNKTNFRAAIDLAPVLVGTVETERKEQLLDGSMQVIESMPRLGYYGYQITDVMIHALRGEEEQALAALREAIDEGWRHEARYLLEFEPNLFSLHGNLDYQAMLAEVRGDLAAQLARVREMDDSIDPQTLGND